MVFHYTLCKFRVYLACNLCLQYGDYCSITQHGYLSVNSKRRWYRFCSNIKLILKPAFDVISEYEKIPCKVAGRVPRSTSSGALDLDSVIPRAEQRNIPTASCYGIVAADEAIRHAGLTFKTEEQSCRAGTFKYLLHNYQKEKF